MKSVGYFYFRLRMWWHFLTWLFLGEEEPEFEAILDTVDPNRTESISLQDYMAYMITKETENVATSDEIVNAFQAITTQEREYITKKELYAHLAKEMADYCLHKMTPYVDPRYGH